jgi:hypothetical protein
MGEMLRLLAEVSRERLFINRLYPIIVAYAGEPMDGHQVVNMLLRAVTECSTSHGGDPATRIPMMERIPDFTAALIKDPEVLRNANERLTALNLGRR